MPLLAIPGWDGFVNQWVAERGGGLASCNYTALGWVGPDFRLTGGIVFHDYNGVNAGANIALERGVNPRGILSAGLTYAFRQLALRRLTFLVKAANIASIELVTGLGAEHEATLREAEPEGDLHIFALFPDSCPLWRRINGKVVGKQPAFSA